MVRHTYSPAWWLPGPHARTIWGRFFRRTPPLNTRVERWDTDDGDFLDIVRLDGEPGRPHLVMLHGLEARRDRTTCADCFSRPRGVAGLQTC